MALVLKDRVKETTSTTGTGTITLGGAVAGFDSFSVVGDGNTTYYAIVSQSPGEWEVGIGTYTASGATLSRTTVLDSSSGGALVDFSAGTKDVFVTYPAGRSVYLTADGTKVAQTAFGAVTVDSVAMTAGSVTTTPVSNTDIANKQYVDNLVVSGIHFHTPVRVETTGNLTATYNNGASGVGATLTNSGAQAALVIDGVTVNVNDRVLVYLQTNQTQNGIYVVSDIGSDSTNWVLTRAADADSYGLASPNVLGEGSAVFVQQGNTGAGETYACNTVGTIVFGTTNITFAQISSAQIYNAGTGLTLTNTTFSITNTGTAGTYGSASQVPVFVTNAQGQVTTVTNTPIAIAAGAVSGLAASATTDTTNASNITSGVLGITYGGTGQTSAGAAINALLPAQTSQSGKYLTTDGTNPSWANVQVPNNGTLTMEVSGIGLSGSATFTADQAGNSTFTVISNATSGNTATTVVARDGAGNFSAGTITAALSGNATTASTLQTARTINGTSFNGASNITTTSWGTARTIQIGGASQSINGSINYSYALSSILSSPGDATKVLLGNTTWGNYPITALEGVSIASPALGDGLVYEIPTLPGGTYSVNAAEWRKNDPIVYLNDVQNADVTARLAALTAGSVITIIGPFGGSPVNLTLTGPVTGVGSSAITIPVNIASTTGSTELVTSITFPTLSGAPAWRNQSLYSTNIVAVATLDINCSLGTYFTKTINGASTFTFSNAPASRAYSFTLELTLTSGSVTWPVSVQWPFGAAPSLDTGKTSLLMFVTDDGGTRWRGAALPNYTT